MDRPIVPKVHVSRVINLLLHRVAMNTILVSISQYCNTITLLPKHGAILASLFPLRNDHWSPVKAEHVS